MRDGGSLLERCLAWLAQRVEPNSFWDHTLCRLYRGWLITVGFIECALPVALYIAVCVGMFWLMMTY